MRPLFVFCIFLLSQFPCTSRGDEGAPSVELHWQGKGITISNSIRQQLCQQAVQLAESSNFNSSSDEKYGFFTLPGVQGDYRREVAGKFLLVSFPTPQKVKTIGGRITVSQIIVGLNRDDFASNLFTIDDTGRIVGHSKYAGEICIQILNAVKQLNR